MFKKCLIWLSKNIFIYVSKILDKNIFTKGVLYSLKSIKIRILYSWAKALILTKKRIIIVLLYKVYITKLNNKFNT